MPSQATEAKGAGSVLQRRRLPVGAEILPEGGAHFRVWAPNCRRVEVVFENDPAPPAELTAEPDGYFAGVAPSADAGALYRFRLDGKSHPYPDPASRFQPDGPHGPSRVVDPRTFRWTDGGWEGVRAEGQVLYELHVGTFTPEGTWAAAAAKLPLLVEVGITCLEVMPVADFPGRFGWGYDGVNLFAPTRLYGEPDEFRAFVDRAHALGLGVILDVVYNHLGPDGNYLKEFSPDYFSTRHKTDWGEAINFDAENSRPVREFFISNARHWIDEYHLDGFRFDATQNIYDDSKDHVLAAITRAARETGRGRELYLIAENEPQDTRIVRTPERGGFGMNALWNDDFHHSAVVAMTGHSEAYFSDFAGSPQELVSSAKYGYLFQGQASAWQKKRRGTPAFDLPATAFVNFIENHDQLANFVHGRRRHWTAGSGRFKAITAFMLLVPHTPMLFQGEEFGASSPFLYFADHREELARLVHRGRREFLCQFPSASTPEMAPCIPDPADPNTFERCKLDWSERDRHPHSLQLHADLLKLRRTDPVFRSQRPRSLDGAVLGPEGLVLRFFGAAGDDRLLVVNLGRDLKLNPAPEPLLAPPSGSTWSVLWSSEDPRYAGCGTPSPETETGWLVQGHSAVVLSPAPAGGPR